MDHEPGRTLSALAGVVTRRARWFIAGWVLIAIALSVLVPSLESVAARDASSFIPGDAPSSAAQEVLDDAFGSGRGAAIVFVVLSSEDGLDRADLAFYRSLSRRLTADTDNVASVQSFVTDPALRPALSSEDGAAAYMVVSLPAEPGSPVARSQLEQIRSYAEDGRPEGLAVHATGPTATIADMGETVDRSIARVTMATVLLILAILLIVYRSLAPMVVALVSIGVSLSAARGVTALLGDHDLLHVSTFTASFLTAVVLGAGTDYAVFQISRFHEMRRDGVEATQAVVAANSRVSAVVIGSALTVVTATGCMLLAQLGLFTSTGPAIAISVLVTLAVSLTFTPALMALMVRRGYLDPKPRPGTDRRWAAVAAMVVGRPGRVLLSGLLVLVTLALFYPALQPSYDERSGQPDDTDSNLGYAALAAHYPLNELLPDYVLIRSDHDLRNARDLAALEGAAAAMARVPDVLEVRGITRPLGTPISEASVGYQAGVVGKKLTRADRRLAQGVQGADRLADGAGRVAEGADQLADGAAQAVDGTGRLLAGLERLHDGVRRAADGAAASESGSARLQDAAQLLAAGLDTAAGQTRTAVDGLALVLSTLESSTGCSVDPACRQARDGLRQIYSGERDRLLPGLRQAADAATRIAAGQGDLTDGLSRLESGLGTARAGLTDLAEGQATLRDRLGDLAAGTRELAGGADQVQAGTAEVAGSVTELRNGLAEAASFLRRTGREAADTSVGGFYLPAKALENPRLALAGSYFLSRDGHTARFIVLGRTDSFDHRAMERAAQTHEAAVRALRGTPLADAEVGSTGIAPSNADIDRLSAHDFLVVALGALLAVFLILVTLLRSLVAPVLLVASVALSYAAAMGLSVLVWQVLIGEPIEWTVPSIAFILLVAVGSDYNLLLMKRMREEAPDGDRAGIARAITSTGSVITTAGLIFAVSMFAMMAGRVTSLEQVGFTIGMGLLLDTFVVRTLVVPAAATLLGRWVWWPSRAALPERLRISARRAGRPLRSAV